MDIGGRKEKEQRLPRTATEQGMHSKALQERLGMVSGAWPTGASGSQPRQARMGELTTYFVTMLDKHQSVLTTSTRTLLFVLTSGSFLK